MNGLFHPENGPEDQVRYMTTPQLAEIAGVSRQTTWRAARKIFPERIREGVAFMLNREESLFLLEHIQPGAWNIGNIETALHVTNVTRNRGNVQKSEIEKPETRGRKSQKALLQEVAEIAAKIAVETYKQGLKDGGAK